MEKVFIDEEDLDGIQHIDGILNKNKKKEARRFKSLNVYTVPYAIGESVSSTNI